jgi:hypothetical protein
MITLHPNHLQYAFKVVSPHLKALHDHKQLLVMYFISGFSNLYVVEGRWDWPISHGPAALQIDPDPVLPHNETKEVHLLFVEATLR